MDQIVACIQIHGDGVELENIFTLVGKDIARTTLNVWKARNNRDPAISSGDLRHTDPIV